MQPGQILVADHDGVYVIKMVGDVRLTLCISFDQFIESMLGKPDFSTVLFDLSEASGIDSTTLGLMARIGIQAKERFNITPTVLSTNAGINRILDAMGFRDIFCVVSELKTPVTPGQPLQQNTAEENTIKQKVIDAHKVLMTMNQQNFDSFCNLVKVLENRP